MAITYREILEARDALAETKWQGWTGEEGTNETAVAFTRYIADINETQLDAFMEYLRRWGSAKNQASFDITVAGGDWAGAYQDTGASANGHAVFERTDGAYGFRVAIDETTGAYHWQLRDLVNDNTLWISSNGFAEPVESHADLSVPDLWLADDEHVYVPKNLGNEILSLQNVAWVSVGEIEHDATDDLMVSDDWMGDDAGVIEPVTGSVSVSCAVGEGIQYRSITDPMENHGKPRAGTWRLTGLQRRRDEDGSFGSRGNWVILQTLALELNDSAPITESGTRWRRMDEELHKSGSRNAVLELPWCDPTTVHALADALNAGGNTFDSSIYTVNAGLLSGKWYHVKAFVRIEDDGYGTIVWMLRSHDNDDFRFAYLANQSETHVHFFKRNMPNSASNIQAFQDTYYFDPSGDFYVSTDGANYTAKNGEAATGTLPADAKRLDAEVVGRAVSGFDPAPDDDAGEIDLHIKLVFSGDGTTYEATFGSRKYYIGVAVAKEPRSVNDPTYDAGLHTAINNGADNELQASVSYDKANGQWNWTMVEKLPKEIEGEGAAGAALTTYGEPNQQIQEWHYRGIAKANVPSPGVGTFSNNGKTVTHNLIQLSVDEATRTWNVLKRVITINAPDDTGDPAGKHWFIGGAEISCDRDSRVLRTWGLTNDGNNWFTFSPDEPGGASPFWGVNGGWYDLNFFFISMARWRARRVKVEMNYFVREPTRSDLAAIGLTTVTGDHLLSTQTSATDDRTKITIQGSGYRWVVIRVTAEVGTWAVDSVNHPDVAHTQLNKVKYATAGWDQNGDGDADGPSSSDADTWDPDADYNTQPDFDYPEEP